MSRREQFLEEEESIFTGIDVTDDDFDIHKVIHSVPKKKTEGSKTISEVVCGDEFTDDLRGILCVEAQGFSSKRWRWAPATIKDWILGERYLNLGSVIRESVYKDVVKFFTPPGSSKNPWCRRYDEAVFCEGIGSGKSFKTSIIITYFQHLLLCLRSPQKYFGIDRSSKIAIMNMSISERNARKVIFSEVASKIYNCKWFSERGWEREDARVPDPQCMSELRFKNNTFIIPGSSSWRTAVGYNIIVGVIDEAGSYRSNDNKDQAEDIYLSLQRRLGSRFENKGAVVVAGSPLYENDFLENKLDEGLDPMSRVLAVRRPLWVAKYSDWEGEFFYVDRVNRRFAEPEEYEANKKNVDKIPNVPFLWKAFNANITKAYRDFGARPSATINGFFEMPRLVMDRANKARTEDPVNYDGTFKEWFQPIDEGAFHAIHVDIGITGDACGFAMGHFDGFTPEGGVKIFLDLMMRFKGNRKEPVQLSQMREYIYQLRSMGFNIQAVTFDGFQSTDTIQILEKKGFQAELLSVDRNTLPYYNLKEAIHEKRLDYYYVKGHGEDRSASQYFVKECMELEEIEGKKIDHPPKGSKDVSDAVAGVVHNIVSRSDEFGSVAIGIC